LLALKTAPEGAEIKLAVTVELLFATRSPLELTAGWVAKISCDAGAGARLR
jgi:hypothetical protein